MIGLDWVKKKKKNNFQTRTVKVGMERKGWLRKCCGSILDTVVFWNGVEAGSEGRIAVGPASRKP